jgi:Ca2+-binding RTX toxin-like protein
MAKPLPANQLVGTPGDDILDKRGSTGDWILDGRAGNDTLYGGEGHDRLLGGRGDDLIFASTEDNLVDGGAGLDTVSFLDSATGVRVELSDGGLGLWPDTNPTTVRSNVLRNIENVTGSNQDDFINGSRAVNELDGGAGNDRLLAWGSGDFLTGGTGADIFDVRQVVSAVRRGTETVSVTDFEYDAGDRIAAGGATPAQLDWVFGSANDAEGNPQPAWIGTWDLPTGGTFELIVVGAEATPPVTDWFI